MKFARLSSPSFSALAVLAVAAMLGLQGAIEYWVIAPLKVDAAALAQEVKNQRDRHAASPPSQSKTTAQLDEILARLESPDATRIRIERLHALADQSSVVIRKASYLNAATPGDIGHREIQLELVATYPAIRQFLRAVQDEDSAAALESLEFSRPPGGGVRAQVRMALYFRKMGARPSA